MSNGGERKSGKRGVFHKFYLVHPKENANADELAERLIMLKPVEEVFLTDGDFGFVVKARFTDGKEPNDVTSFISKNINSKFGKAVSHYEYKK